MLCLQKAVAKRNRELLRKRPEDCSGEDSSFWGSITSALTFKTDECAEWHVKLAVDPMWEVSPSDVSIKHYFAVINA